MPEAPNFVAPADLDTLLTQLEGLPGDPQQGFFGPHSIRWQIDRESALFLGAGRAVLLQLAHPWVAASLAHHSDLFHDAIGRFHSTFRVVYTMLFGTRAQALASARRLHRRHSTVTGELPHAVGAHPAHEQYAANEVAALLWVHATLVGSAILTYEFVLGPLPAAAREAYYAEGARLAALFGIPAAALPPDWQAFTAYCDAMFASPVLGVDANARLLGQSVLAGVGTWVHPPFWYKALTASWLPPRLRDAFALPFGSREQRAVTRAARWVPRLYPLLPKALRYVGPFHEAQARLHQRPVTWLTERSNRFWMGQPRLLYNHLGTLQAHSIAAQRPPVHSP